MAEKIKITKPQSKASNAIAQVQRKKSTPGRRAEESKTPLSFLGGFNGGQAAVQAKLSIGAPNDKYEVEADQMASEVMRMPETASSRTGNSELRVTGDGSMAAVRRKCADCKREEEDAPRIQKKDLAQVVSLRNRINTVQRVIKPNTNSVDHIENEQNELKIQRYSDSDRGRGPPEGDFSSKLNQSKGSGQPLDSHTNSFMSSRFGADFSNVKVHTGNNAAQMSNDINAKAFTHQNHIYFNQGQYQPNTTAGKTLLAHELTHTIQQGAVNGNVQRKCAKCDEDKIRRKLTIGSPNDRLEQEADTMADRVMRKANMAVNGHVPKQGLIQRQNECGSRIHRQWGGFYINGDCSFVRAVRNDLNVINATSLGNSLLNWVSRDRSGIFSSLISINRGPPEFTPVGSNGYRINYDPNWTISDSCDLGAWRSAPNYVYLFHEIVHFWLYMYKGYGYDDRRECMATGLGSFFGSMNYNENKFRCALGLPVRPCYGSACRTYATPTCGNSVNTSTVQRKCAKCQEDKVQRKGDRITLSEKGSIRRKLLDDATWAPIKVKIQAYQNKVEKDGATEAAITTQINSICEKSGYTKGKTNAKPILGKGYYNVRVLHMHADQFEFKMSVNPRWDSGKEYVHSRMESLPIPDRNKAGIDAALKVIKTAYLFDELKARSRDTVDDREKPGWRISAKMGGKSARAIAGVDDLTNIRDGSATNPIKILWYKPPKRYPKTVSLSNRKKGQRLHNRNSTDQLAFKGTNIQIGVKTRPSGSTVIEEGDVLTRTKSKRSGTPQSNYREALTKCGYNWKGKDADHVLDLGFGGKDDYDNLWPLNSTVNRRAYRDKYYHNYRVVRKTDSKNAEIQPISDLYGKRFQIVGFFDRVPKPYPLGGIQAKLKEKPAHSNAKKSNLIQREVLKGCEPADEKTKKEQEKTADQDKKKGLKEKLKEFQEKVKRKIKAFKEKIKNLIIKVKAKFKELLKGKQGASFSSWGSGLMGALARAAFKIIKVVARLLIGQTFDLLKTGFIENLDRVIASFEKDLSGEVPELTAKIEEMETLFFGLRDKFQDEINTIVSGLVAPFENYMKEFERVKEILENITALVNAAKWIYRILACVSPPLVGCLWIAVQSLGEALMAKIVSSCKFQKKIAPLVLKEEFVRNIPVHLANLFSDAIKPILPTELHAFFPEIKPQTVSISEFDCAAQMTPEQLAFAKLMEELGEEKIRALELLMKKGGIPDNTPFDMAAVQRIIDTVNNSGLSAEDIAKLAENYNPDTTETDPKIQHLKTLLERLQDHTGVSNKKKESGVDTKSGNLVAISELKPLNKWFILDDKTGLLIPKGDFNAHFKSFQLTWTFSNNLVVKFDPTSNLSVKKEKFDFGSGKEDIQRIKFDLLMFAEIIPPHITGIERGDEFKFKEDVIWRIKERKSDRMTVSPIHRNMETYLEVDKGKVALKKDAVGVELDLGEITAVLHNITSQKRSRSGLVNYSVSLTPKRIIVEGANYVQNQKVIYFEKDKTIVVQFSHQVETSDIQPKLKIGNPHDELEKQADRTADQVLKGVGNNPKTKRDNANRVWRKCAKCEEDKIQRKSWEKEEDYNPYLKVQRKANSGSAGVVDSNFEQGLSTTKGNGRPMDKATQTFMENRFGADFSGVKVHNNSQAANLSDQIQAKAFTVGNDIYFNQGQYNPESNQGKHLLAHELTHTLQQGAASPTVQKSPDDPVMESEIHDFGIVYAENAGSVTLFAQPEYQSSDENSELPSGSKVMVSGKFNEFYAVTLYHDSAVSGYVASQNLVQAQIDPEGHFEVENNVVVMDKESFEESYPDLAAGIGSLYWDYHEVGGFVESLDFANEGIDFVNQLGYWSALRYEQGRRRVIEGNNDYSAKNIYIWLDAVDSLVRNMVPLLAAERNREGTQATEAVHQLGFIRDVLSPSIDGLLAHPYLDAGRAYKERQSIQKVVESLEYQQQSPAEKALPVVLEFLRLNPVRVEAQSEYSVYGAQLAQLLVLNQRNNQLNTYGFGLSAEGVREVFALLQNENAQLAQQAMYRGETIGWLVAHANMSGFGDFRAAGEGLLSGLSRGYYEEMNTSQPAPFDQWGIADSATFYLWYSLGVPSGLALGAKDLVVGLFSLFTPSFWREMYKLFTDEEHRFKMGVGLGTAMAKEIRTYQSGDPATIGWKLGVLTGRIGFEVVFSLLTAGAFQITKMAWASKFPKLAAAAEFVASSRVGQIAAAGASFVMGKLDDIIRVIRSLTERLPALTAAQRMNRQILLLERESAILLEAAQASKALALADQVEEAASSIARLEEQAAALETRFDDVIDMVEVDGQWVAATDNMPVSHTNNAPIRQLEGPVSNPNGTTPSTLPENSPVSNLLDEVPTSREKPTRLSEPEQLSEPAFAEVSPNDKITEELLTNVDDPQLPVLHNNQGAKVYTEGGMVEVKMPDEVVTRGRSSARQSTESATDDLFSTPRTEGGSTTDDILEVLAEETAHPSPGTRVRGDGSQRQLSVAESDRIAGGHTQSIDDLRGLESRTKVADSHDMGVERGIAYADSQGIKRVNWNNPESYIGLYGRGIDDLGRNGSKWVILEWKGGPGAKKAANQMSDAWVGRKLAELEHLNDPMAATLLSAAKRGQLEGRVYTTLAHDVTSQTDYFSYNYADVYAAYLKRLAEL